MALLYGFEGPDVAIFLWSGHMTHLLFQKEDIEKCRVDGSLQFLVLKKLNRLAHIRCKKVRDETNEVHLTLVLQTPKKIALIVLKLEQYCCTSE